MKPPEKLRLRSNYWIVNEEEEVVFGRGRMEILANIEKTGSINQAAKVMKMSYKGVWSKIKSTEKHLKIKVVHSDRKAGTHLTAEGKILLKNYRRLMKKCIRTDDRIFDTIFKSFP
ncbi:MAG: ModE family transcriptional regulator [Deltaproteobacteria bacterium]|nr:MAG: ModE family transcriptional regulator [Deltaproteobacteria bacterium]